MNSVRSNNLSLKYQRVNLIGCKDIEIRKFECGKTSISFLQTNNKNIKSCNKCMKHNLQIFNIDNNG